MSNGELTNILVSTDVTRYLEFKQIAGSYVQQGNGAKATVAKVPSDAGEALRSPLMGLFEKRRAKKFLEWVGAFKEDDPATHNGMNLRNATMKEVYDKFGLETTTRDFIGHSMALYQTDEYINSAGQAQDAVQRIRLYVNSMARYGKSPYIYPLYGLGELPQGFARLSAIYGGTYMLNTDVDEVLYEGGKVSGIKATMKDRAEAGEGMRFETKCKKVLADPSYFSGKAQVVGHLLKAICILNHPVDRTDNSDSLQLIIPQSQVGRKHGTLYDSPMFNVRAALLTNPFKIYISLSYLRRIMSARRATTLPSLALLPKATATTIWSFNLGSTALVASRRSSWVPRYLCMNRSKAESLTAFSSVRATTPQATLRQPPVSVDLSDGTCSCQYVNGCPLIYISR